MHRLSVLILASAVLAGCGSSPEQQAAQACADEVARKITDKEFRLDLAEMASHAKADGEDMLRIEAAIVFDPGLPREAKQTIDCKVRLQEGQAEVISLQFIW